MTRTGTVPGTTEALLAAAVQLIPELGWGKVSSRLVADRAGVNPALVHYHFGSVAALLRQAAARAARTAVLTAVEGIRSAVDPVEAVHALLQDRAGADATDHTSGLLHEAALAAARDSLLKAALAGTLAEARTVLATRLADVPGLPDPESRAAAVIALIDGYLLHRQVDPALDPDLLLPALTALLRAPTGARPDRSSDGTPRREKETR